MKNTPSDLFGVRAKLLVELFLQDLKPASIARTPEDYGYDFLVRFPNSNGGINTFGVEVKATTEDDPSSFAVNRKLYNFLAHSNFSSFLLVADVKRNKLYYGFPPRIDTRKIGSGPIDFPLTPLDEKNIRQLRKRLTA